MVPEAVGGPGSRAARPGADAKHGGTQPRGLEAALVDKSIPSLRALDALDARIFSLAVAGPAALIVSKLHKIRERLGEREQRRLDAKDALDVLRLLRAVPTGELASTFTKLLNTELSSEVTREALAGLKDLFRAAGGVGSQI